MRKSKYLLIVLFMSVCLVAWCQKNHNLDWKEFWKWGQWKHMERKTEENVERNIEKKNKKNIEEWWTEKIYSWDLVILPWNSEEQEEKRYKQKQEKKQTIQSFKQEIENKKKTYLKKLPHCKTTKLNTGVKIKHIDDVVQNCITVKAEGNFIDWLWWMARDYKIKSWKLTDPYHNDLYNNEDYQKAYCIEPNVFGDYEWIYYNIDLAKTDDIQFTYFLPLLKRIESIENKGLISSVLVFNREVGPVWLFGWQKYFWDIPHFWYQEYDSESWKHHYLIVGYRTFYDNEWNYLRRKKVLVIDDKLYNLGNREYLPWIEGETGATDVIKKSEREFVKFKWDNVIVKRINNAKYKKWVTNKNIRDNLWKPVSDYDLEICEVPLWTSSESFMNENNKIKDLGIKEENIYKNNKTKPISCEKENYYKQLVDNKKYTLVLNQKTERYEVEIPELCAKFTTNPWEFWTMFDWIKEEIPIILSWNKLLQAEGMEREIMEFKNKDPNIFLQDIVNQEAIIYDKKCRLISWYAESMKKNDKEQAEVYQYFAPAWMSGWDFNSDNICELYWKSDKQWYKYGFVQYDEKYPWIYVYQIDRWGERNIEKNLNITFKEKTLEK